MLETIREYAVERLEARGEGARIRKLHAEHCLECARTARGDLALEERDWTGALRWYREALAGQIDTRDRMYLFAGMGALAARTGRRVKAARLWGAAERIESEDDQGLEAHQRPGTSGCSGSWTPTRSQPAGPLRRTKRSRLPRRSRGPIPVPGAAS